MTSVSSFPRLLLPPNLLPSLLLLPPLGSPPPGHPPRPSSKALSRSNASMHARYNTVDTTTVVEILLCSDDRVIFPAQLLLERLAVPVVLASCQSMELNVARPGKLLAGFMTVEYIAY